MGKRKSISSSLRWQVFARDNFTCRYCGARAGQDGVELAADHLVSVADGGDNSFENLLTACQKCNGGKGAKSLMQVPDAAGVAERMSARAKSIQDQADAMRSALESERQPEQQAINLKCDALGIDEVTMAPRENSIIIQLCKEFGAETVLHWYRLSVGPCPEHRAIKYVCGIARNTREKMQGENA